MVLAGVVLFLGGLLAAAWLYSQTGDQVQTSPTTEKVENVSVPGLLMKSSILTQTGAPSTHSTQVTTPALSIPEIIHADVYFEVGRKGLTAEGKAQLAAQSDMLNQHEEYGVLIQGYTDQQGSASYNMQLGLKRAETVKAELVNAGIAEHRIKTVSLGEEGALCVDTSDTCRQMNRRVHLEVRKIGQEHMVLPVIPVTITESDLPTESSSTTSEGGTTETNLPPSWSDPFLIPEPTKGR
jgi:peptidoglycan-associated lipoprotein